MTATFDGSRSEELTGLLKAGIDALTTGEDWKRYLAFQAQLRHYSFANTMLILSQRPDATLVMAEGERKDGKHIGWYAIDRFLSPGAQPIWIWSTYTKTVKAEQEGEQDRRYRRFHPVKVYDIADTYGKPVPQPNSRLEGDDAKGLLKLTLDFITDYGFTYELVPSIGGQANGDMNPVAKHIRICTEGRSTAQQAKTALHEAAHMALHSDGKGISIPREQKEIEAESTAFVVSAHLGTDTSAYSFGYIASWAQHTGFSHRTAIKHSAKRITKAARTILEFIDPQDGPEDDGGPE